MTIEFPDEPDTAPTVASPTARVRSWSALPWTVPTVSAVVALFLPVTSAHIGGFQGFSEALKVDTYPFGRVRLSGGLSADALGAQYGWVWLAVAVVLAAAGVVAFVRPGTPWPGVVGTLAGGAGIGSTATLAVALAAPSSARTTGPGLAAGAWLLLSASVVGLVLGVVTMTRSSRHGETRPTT